MIKQLHLFHDCSNSDIAIANHFQLFELFFSFTLSSKKGSISNIGSELLVKVLDSLPNIICVWQECIHSCSVICHQLWLMWCLKSLISYISCMRLFNISFPTHFTILLWFSTALPSTLLIVSLTPLQFLSR